MSFYLGYDIDAASTVGGSGSVNSHLRLMTTQLDNLYNKPAASVTLSGATISVPNPLGVSGTVTTTQGTGNAGTSPWAVSGTVSIGNQPTVNQGVLANNAFWSVSGAVVTLNGSLFINNALATIQQAQIDTSSAGDTTVVSGTTNKKIRVIGITLSTAGAVSVQWKSSGGSTISPAMTYGGAGGGMDVWRPEGYFCETVTGENLVLNLSTGVGVQGNINYIVY